MRRRLVLFAAVLATPGTAHAGRSFFGWLYDTEVIPERGAEITTFLSEENRKADEANGRNSNWWIAPQIGITDQLELTLPVEVEWSQADNQGPRTIFKNYGAELRYRLVTQDPVDKPEFSPLVRIALKRQVVTRDVWQPELDFVGAYEVDSVRAVVDLGVVGEINADKHHFEARPGAGVSIKTIEDLRLGAEVFAEISLDDDAKWVAAGPNLAWSHGRSWISAAYGIGLYHIRDAPKLNWGIAF